MSSVAVVLGGADCLENDYRAFRDMSVPATVVAVNDAGIVTPHIDHWVTGHPEELWWRKEKRREKGHGDDYETWTKTFPYGYKKRERMCDHVLGGWGEGSSGLLAVGVALHLGHDRVILCGVPMDARPHFNRAANWGGHTSYREAWEEKKDDLGAVRSMSGWTRRLLGAPTADWLCLTGRGGVA